MSAWTALAKTTKINEIRLHLCQTSPAAQGLRSFIQSQYLSMKKANPLLPIMIRECKGVPTRAFIQFERGLEKKVALDNMSADEVQKVLRTAMGI